MNCMPQLSGSRLAWSTRQRSGRSRVAASSATAGAPAAVLRSDAKTQEFQKWAMEKAGVKSSGKLQVAEFGGVRGMQASMSIQPEEVLVSVPRATAITLAPKQRAPAFVKPEFWANTKACPWFVKMGLLVLQEKRAGSASRLAPYIDQLPEKFDLPVLWDDAKLQQLQYPHLIHQVKEQQLEWSKLYTELANEGLVAGAAPVSQKDFFWALCAVRSRTFSGPYIGSTLQDRLRTAGLVAALAAANTVLGLADPQRTLAAVFAVFAFNILYEVILSQSTKQYALCPLIDFINHSSRVENEVSYDYFADAYSVTAGEAYKAGDQVFISYGDKQTNDSLMQFYGFSEADNPHDVYVMTNLLKWLEAQVHPAQARLDALNNAGLLRALQLVSVQRGGFPADTLQALRFVLATDEEAAAGVSAFATPGSTAMEARLSQVLVHACNSELNSLGTTLAEDTALLSEPKKGSKGQGLSSEERLAVFFRQEKKKVLQAALKALKGV